MDILALASKSGALKGARLVLPFGVAAICVAIVLSKLEAGALAALPAQLSQLSLAQVLAAALFTMISFWAVGRYDVVTHRALGTGITQRRAQIAGTSAIALSQTLGFGVFTAAIARWRMLPDLSLPAALRISAFVSVSFIMALGVICALAFLVLPMPAWMALPTGLILLGVAGFLALSLLVPAFSVLGFRLTMPSLRTSGAIFGWTLVDTVAAALALYVLLPSGEMTFTLILPAYLLALAAGLMSGAPGGVGPFELALLSILPKGAEGEVLAAAVAFRAIYYALPAILAGVALFHPLPAPAPATARPMPLTNRPAELGLLRQNGGKIGLFGTTTCALWPTPHSLCLMFDPLSGPPQTALRDLQHAARRENKLPVVYKCKARTALAARTAGWQVAHIADEAVLTPATFDLSTRPCRDLRRKLRQADRAGVHVSTPVTLPLDEMARIDAHWQAQKGPARGGSMGRFCAEYLTQQQVFLAYHEGRLVGYLSLHTSAQEWCLDLMRNGPDAPTGTMQKLVAKAIVQAKADGITTLSLASVPATPDRTSRIAHVVASVAAPFSKTDGLRRFKASFDPRWEHRYAAAPGPLSLGFTLLDITRSIHWPAPLATTNTPHKENEECEVALHMLP